MKHLFSNSGSKYEQSPIELKMESKNEDVKPIFLSIGVPHPSSIPTDILHEITKHQLLKEPRGLKYGSAKGDERLIRYLIQKHLPAQPHLKEENVLITSGSTQGLDLLCKLFINPGDVCITEGPTYSNIFSTMANYQAEVIEIPIDKDGMNPDDARKMLDRLRTDGKRVKLLCLIPNAQNPSGVTMPEERRIRFYEMAKEYDFMIVEDDPYHELMFSKSDISSIYSFDNQFERVIHLNSFSKVIAPGFRVGWMFAHSNIIERLTIFKESMDGSSNPFTQSIIASFCEKGHLEQQIMQLLNRYQNKKDVMVRELFRYFGKNKEVEWEEPCGGMFLWVSFHQDLDTKELLEYAQEEGVFFVPGESFSHKKDYRNFLRLCFAYSDEEEIKEGIRRLHTAYIRMMEVKIGIEREKNIFVHEKEAQ